MAQSQTVKNWEKVTGKALANAIFSETKGDCTQLAQSTVKKNSIWGRICFRLSEEFGEEFHKPVDRLWCESAYTQNFQNVKVIENIIVTYNYIDIAN